MHSLIESFSTTAREARGAFFSEKPELSLDPEPNPQGGSSYVPSITATIGLKPFDLGVSQKLAIAMPPDEEAREYKVRIEIQRLSGTRDSWLRLNKDFVSQIRQHFSTGALSAPTTARNSSPKREIG